MALSLTVGPNSGVAIDYTNFVNFRSIATTNSVEVAADTMSFDIWNYNNETSVPLEGWEVIFKDGATIEFAGVIVNINRRFSPEMLGKVYQCDCRDYVYFLNRRLVNETYTSQTAGSMIKAILLDLYNDSDDDVHYEFFKDNLTNIDDGPTLSQFKFDKVMPSHAFDMIAQACGCQWWVGYNKNVYFKNVNVLSSSAFLPLGTLDIDNDITNYFDYEEEHNIETVGTKLTLRDIEIRSTAIQTDEFKGSDGKGHNGNLRKIFNFNRKPYSFLDIISVTKDTGSGPVAQLILSEDIDGSPTDSVGASNEVFSFIDEEGGYIRFSDSNVVGATDDIAISYRYSVKDNNESVDTDGVLEMQIRTGGDGIHEFLYAQSSGLKIVDLDDLDNIEDVLLARKSKIIKRGSFKSWTKGWQAGQTFLRLWESEHLVDPMFVATVSKSVLTPADDPNLLENVIFSQVVFSSTPYSVSV